MLDTSVLLQLRAPGHPATKQWFRELLLSRVAPELLASVLAEYELRRALDRRGASRSLEHFDELSASLRFVPVSAEATRRAVGLQGVSGADAIIAAQAMSEGAVLVTSDQELRAVPGLDARDWSEIDPARLGDLRT